ncbi:MAG: hypothetical protein AABX08_03715 [Nanoarchaeota archaeon]
MNKKNLKIDLDEIRESVERNRKERLEFVEKYAEWLRKKADKK